MHRDEVGVVSWHTECVALDHAQPDSADAAAKQRLVAAAIESHSHTMSNPGLIGVALLVGGGLVLLAWLAYAWWDVGKRGESSGAISKAGYALLEANVGRHRRQQMRAMVIIGLALVIILAVAVLVARSAPHAWSSWGS